MQLDNNNATDKFKPIPIPVINVIPLIIVHVYRVIVGKKNDVTFGMASVGVAV